MKKSNLQAIKNASKGIDFHINRMLGFHIFWVDGKRGGQGAPVVERGGKRELFALKGTVPFKANSSLLFKTQFIWLMKNLSF
jgi:hypothetical protein